MKTKHERVWAATAIMLAATVGWPYGAAAQKPSSAPLYPGAGQLRRRRHAWSRALARSTPIKRSPAGQTFHGDHAYVFYQVPVNARTLPLVMWHGFGQFSKTWETTPDGREGFQTLFLRRGFPVYLIDQPRRGRAGRSTVPTTISADARRAGLVRHVPPRHLAGLLSGRAVLARPGGAEPVLPPDHARHRSLRPQVAADAVDRAVRQDRPRDPRYPFAQRRAWDGASAIRDTNVRAIVSYEPGSGFVFPEGEVPPPMPTPAAR